MKQVIGAVLIIFAIILGIDGVKKFDESSESVKFLGITISAENEGGKETAFIEIALAVAALAGGVYLLKNTRS